MQHDGVRGLYRGFVFSCVGIAAYRGLYFGLYDSFNQILQISPNMFVLRYFIGLTTTLISQTVVYPFDTITKRMIMTSIQ